MAIINTSLRRLFQSPPALNASQIERLTRWLKTAYQPNFTRRTVEIQQEMLDELIESEKATQAIVSRRSAALDSIPALKASGNIEAVRAAQGHAADLSRAAAANDYYRSAIRLVGDHMAQRIIGDPDIIKGFGLKQSPGYISGKDGLQSELEAFEHFLKKGYIVLLNDLTACVRAGDLTLRKGEELRFFEVKSSAKAYMTKETQEQILMPMVVQDYVKSDAMPVSLEGEDAVSIRLDSPPEDLHWGVAGELLKGLPRSGYREAARGAKIYVAARREATGALRSRVEELTANGDWVVANVAVRVTQYHDLPPFTQWIRPDHAIATVSGEVIVLSAYRMQDMRELAEAARLRISWKATGTDTFPIRYEPMDPSELQLLNQDDFMIWHRLRISYTLLPVEDYVAKAAGTFRPEALAQLESKRSAAAGKLRVLQHPSMKIPPKPE